jgi:hypothetical protein
MSEGSNKMNKLPKISTSDSGNVHGVRWGNQREVVPRPSLLQLESQSPERVKRKVVSGCYTPRLVAPTGLTLGPLKALPVFQLAGYAFISK